MSVNTAVILAVIVAIASSLLPLLVFVIAEPFFYELPVDAVVRISSSEALTLDSRPSPSSTHIIVNSNKSQFNITLELVVLKESYSVMYEDMAVDVDATPIYYIVLNETGVDSVVQPMCGVVRYDIVDSRVVFSFNVNESCEFAVSSDVRVVFSVRETVFLFTSRKSTYAYYDMVTFRIIPGVSGGETNVVEYKPLLVRTMTPRQLANMVLLIVASVFVGMMNLYIIRWRKEDVNIQDVLVMLMIGLAIALLLAMKIASAYTI